MFNILNWERFFEKLNSRDLKFPLVIQDSLISEGILKHDPFKIPPPFGSALFNLPITVDLEGGDTELSEDHHKNFYSIYFYWDTTFKKRIVLDKQFRDPGDERTVEIYEMKVINKKYVTVDDRKFGQTVPISEFKVSNTQLNPSGEITVLFEFTAHARVSQWRHGIITDRRQTRDHFPIYDLLNKKIFSGDTMDMYDYCHSFPRIDTFDIVELAKDGLYEVIDKEYNNEQIFSEQYDKFINGPVQMTQRFFCEKNGLVLVCEVHKKENFYIFKIITVWKHPKFGSVPPNLPNVIDL